MEDHTFDCGGARDAAGFVETLKEVENYLQRTLKRGANDVALAVKNLEHLAMTTRTLTGLDVNAMNPLEQKIWFAAYQTEKTR